MANFSKEFYHISFPEKAGILLVGYNEAQRTAMRRASKFARASACSEFAVGWDRWHGRIAIVVRSSYFFNPVQGAVNFLFGQ